MSVATSSDLWRMCATELAAAIRSGEASSREIVDAHLRRIEEVNPAINAVTVLLGEQALDMALAADRARARGDDLPPLHGVPFTVKENIDLAGTPTTQGLPALTGAYPDRDAPDVARLRAAGAIPIGRTNCPDMGIRWHADSELRGPTANPWDRSRTPGGSSGGEAAALATGMTPLGVGGDLGGSLRWPAQCCGIAALRPTLGRIPHATTIEPVDAPLCVQLMLADGPLARRVADLRAALDVMSGATWRDPWSVPSPVHGPELAKRVALVPDPAAGGTADQVRDGVRIAARALHDAGYTVDEAEPPAVDAAAKVWLDMLCADMKPALQIMSFPWGPDTDRFVSALFALAPDPNSMTTPQVYLTRHSLLRAWAEFQENHPLIVAPIFTGIPWEVGHDLTPAGVAEILHGMRLTIAVNALGLPAVAVPVGIGDGLPQAVQLIGPRHREDLCLDAAAAIEDRLGTFTPIDPR